MIESSDEMKRDFGKEWASLSKGVSLRATLSKIEQQGTTSTEISVSHRTPSLISRVTSHELMGLTSRSDPKKTCRCSHETRMTRDSKGQETPLDSKFDRDASTHQRKKVQNQKNFLGGHKIRPQDLLSKVAKSVRWWNYLVSITRWEIALLQRPFVRGIANILGVYHQVIRSNVLR